jgi:DNA-binding transcriptional LysR family regulator
VVAGPDLPRPSGGVVPAVVRGADPARSWTLAGPVGPVTLAVDAVLRLSSLVMIRDAVRAGAGAARLPLSLVLHDVAGGRLANWGDVAGSEIALWALYPSRRLLNARVSAFLDLLRQSFPQAASEELAAYLAG